MFQGASSESKSGKKLADEAIRLIDLQIANLHESIRILNSQRNGHLLISALPVEILTKIFLLHQENTRRYAVRGLEPLDWIGRITHVSRRWRKIALDFSSLWIRIPFYHPKWATEMISRSLHICPIVKTTYNPSKYPSEARLLKTFLQQHLSRIQVLEIQCKSHQLVAKLFQDIPPTSVPCLSTLSLLMPWQEPGTEPSPADSLQILDTRLIDTNSLRTVEAPTTLSWNLRLFSGLTHLRMMVTWHESKHHNVNFWMPYAVCQRFNALIWMDLFCPKLSTRRHWNQFTFRTSKISVFVIQCLPSHSSSITLISPPPRASTLVVYT